MKNHGFRAGSYSGYNENGEDLLAKVALDLGALKMFGIKIDSSGYGYDEIPFSEQINFSDADGTIGPVASQKLV